MSKIIIIGAGISGLSAGVYAQKAGFESQIFEKNNSAGGECTGWNRKGYHIDGSIHWLMGSKEGTKLNSLWKEIGALNNVEIYQPEYFSCTICEGKAIFLYRDRQNIENHLIEIYPDDKEEIINLLNCSEAFSDFEPPVEKPLDLMKLSEKLNFFKSMSKMGPVYNKYKKISAKEYVTRFKSPGIRLALQSLMPDYYKACDLFFTIGIFISGNAGKPKGGSRAFTGRIVQNYKSMGGNIQLNAEVEKIIIQKGVAKGIQLTDGSIHYADYIIAACDTHIIFNKLLEGKYISKEFDIRYKDPETYPLLPCIYIALGVDKNLSDYPIVVTFQTEPFDFEDKKIYDLSFKHYCNEPSFAPNGKSVITVYIQAQYDWWLKKRINIDDYKSEKNRLSNEVIDRIEKQYPELKGKIEALDVATPLTFERYCGAFKGSYMSFGDTPNAKPLNSKGVVRGVKNLFLAGQWAMPPGGAPNAALAGKWAVDRVINNQNKKKRKFFNFRFIYP